MIAVHRHHGRVFVTHQTDLAGGAPGLASLTVSGGATPMMVTWAVTP
jgi:hypothetical protein